MLSHEAIGGLHGGRESNWAWRIGALSRPNRHSCDLGGGLSRLESIRPATIFRRSSAFSAAICRHRLHRGWLGARGIWSAWAETETGGDDMGKSVFYFGSRWAGHIHVDARRVRKQVEEPPCNRQTHRIHPSSVEISRARFLYGWAGSAARQPCHPRGKSLLPAAAQGKKDRASAGERLRRGVQSLLAWHERSVRGPSERQCAA